MASFFDFVDVFTTSIPAPSWIALGIFVGEEGTLGLHDGWAGEVFRGDELDVFILALLLILDGGEEIGISHGETTAGGFTEAGFVASAFVRASKEGFDHFQGGLCFEVIGPEAEDVAIVMLAGCECFRDGAWVGRSHIAEAVGGKSHTDAGATDEDATIIAAVMDTSGDGIAVVGIIDRVAGVGSEVGDRDSFFLQGGNDGGFE